MDPFAGGSEATAHTGEDTGPVLGTLTDRRPVHYPLTLSTWGAHRPACICVVCPQKREQGAVFEVFKITKLERRLPLCKLIFSWEKAMVKRLGF